MGLVNTYFSLLLASYSFFYRLYFNKSPSFDFDLLLDLSKLPSMLVRLVLILDELAIELLLSSKILFLLDLVTLLVLIIWGWIVLDSWRSILSFFDSSSI